MLVEKIIIANNKFFLVQKLICTDILPEMAIDLFTLPLFKCSRSTSTTSPYTKHVFTVGPQMTSFLQMILASPSTNILYSLYV